MEVINLILSLIVYTCAIRESSKCSTDNFSPKALFIGMFGFVLKFSYRLCFRLINLFRMLSRNVYYRVYYSTFHVRS